MSLSSTAIVMQLLQERGEFTSRHGTGTFAVLLMQDLTVVPLLALVPLLSDTAAIASGIPQWKQLLILGGMFLYYAVRLKSDDGVELPMKVFRFSINYLMILFAALLIDHYFIFRITL